MTDQEQRIIDRCKALGIGRCGLGSIRNFIAAAFYHVGLPGTLDADKHVAFNSAIRFATNRIACQGRDGPSIWQSRVISRKALDRSREPDITPAEWAGLVTFEHQDPVLAVQTWIGITPSVSVDDVVLRLLDHPGVVVLRKEEQAIDNRFKSSGSPHDRYLSAGIEVVQTEEGVAAYFRSIAPRARAIRRRKYHTNFVPFESENSDKLTT